MPMKIIVALLLIVMPNLLQAQKNKKTDDTRSVVNSSETMNQSKALFIVDGVRMQPNDSLNNLDSINSDNIENVSVLKGEQAILQYGGAGKNGVILVTTKTPAKKEPLYIVDGLKTKTIFISPDDIESMSVLKGKENTSLYGAEGDAGVILITTKKSKNQDRK
jgi:TonB-dependent SusC/RagA subfamily outer membrane receptor